MNSAHPADGSAVLIAGLYVFKNRIVIIYSPHKYKWENVIHAPKINMSVRNLSADNIK